MTTEKQRSLSKGDFGSLKTLFDNAAANPPD